MLDGPRSALDGYPSPFLRRRGAAAGAPSGPTEWTFVGTTNVGGGTYNAGQTHQTSFPAGWAAGDLAILQISYDPTNQTLPAVPAGWTAIDQARNTGTASTNDAAGGLYRRVLQAGDVAPLLTQGAGGNYFRARMAVFRGADPDAPIEAVAVGQEILQSIVNDHAAVTTLGLERMIAYFECGGSAATHISFTDADLASVTQAHHDASTSGNDHYSSMHYGVKATAGAVGANAVHTINISADVVIWTVALKPAWLS